jgi:hypothetical protein
MTMGLELFITLIIYSILVLATPPMDLFGMVLIAVVIINKILIYF